MQQQLKRCHKPQELMNKLKQTEFLDMLEEKLYGGVDIIINETKV